MEMMLSGTCLRAALGGVGLMVGLHDLKGLFQPNQLYEEWVSGNPRISLAGRRLERLLTENKTSLAAIGAGLTLWL